MESSLLDQMDVLQTTDPLTGEIFWGGDQDWYSTPLRRKAGCGPTTATNILAYLSRTQADKEVLWQPSSYNYEDYQVMMEKVWNFVTPTKLGLYSIRDLAQGMINYASTYQIPIAAHTLNLSFRPRQRKKFSEVEVFVLQGLAAGSPIAFLNYSRGKETELESWHWVTLMGLELFAEGSRAIICDNGIRKKIDLKLWYETSRLGGGMVSFQGLKI